MTTLEAELSLMRYFGIIKNLIVPRVTSWSRGPIRFETDLLVLSNSGYATGVEIKVSKSDLKNDIKKSHIAHYGGLIEVLDYTRIKNRVHDGKLFETKKVDAKEMYFNALKHFYYAVPIELKNYALNQIPDDFGLLVMYKYDGQQSNNYHVKAVKSPKLLFNRKWTDNERYDLARLGTMRIYNLKQSVLKLNN